MGRSWNTKGPKGLRLVFNHCILEQVGKLLFVANRFVLGQTGSTKVLLSVRQIKDLDREGAHIVLELQEWLKFGREVEMASI